MTQVLIELEDETGTTILGCTQVPVNIHRNHLLSLANQPEDVHFYLNGHVISETLKEVLDTQKIDSHESVLKIRTCQSTPEKDTFYCSEAFSGHEAPVLCVAMDKDVLVTGGGDCTTRFWCTLTKTPKKICKNNNHWVQRICFADDIVATGDMEGRIVMYTREGALLREISAHRRSITCLAYKKHLISGGRDNMVKFWKLNGECVFSYSHLGPVSGIVAGDLVVTAGRDGKTKVFSGFQHVADLGGHSQPVNCLDVWNSYIVTGGDDGFVCIWKDLSLVKKIAHRREVISVSIARNGMFFATGSFDKTVKIVALESGVEICTYRHLNYVYSVMALGDKIISCSKDKSLKVFSVTKKEVICTFVCNDEVYCFDYLEGSIVAGCRDKKLYFYR
eukprot:jgi/Antlo1/693/604